MLILSYTPSQNLLTGAKIITPVIKEEIPTSSSIPSTENVAPSLDPPVSPTNAGVFAPPTPNNDIGNSKKIISSEIPTIPISAEEKETTVPPPTIPISSAPNRIATPEEEMPSAPQPIAPAVTGFDPFKDEPSKPKVNPIEQQPIEVIPSPPLPPTPPPSFNPFEDKPLVPNQPVPPPPPSFNPFENEVSPSSQLPVLEDIPAPPPPPPPSNVDPFNSSPINPAPEAKDTPFDPFAEEGESLQNKGSDVPLGDVFNTPPTPSPEENSFENIPPPPPPPPTFNPFDLPPLPGE